jgi:DNA/RNA-binding domain of Phe-tRNA-synthetase-like protein
VTGEPPTPLAGHVAPELQAEFPGLRIQSITVPLRPGPSPPSVVRRLRDLSNRYLGAGVVSMRTKAVPQAFRAFFRHIGLDPDVQRIPSEAAAVARLVHGGFRSVDLITDACLVALIETGVPVWALDADQVDDSGLGIRVLSGRETAGPHDDVIPPGSLVVADDTAVHAVLFENPGPGHGVGPRTRRVTVFAVAVDGVPEIHVDEALWCAVDML